MSGRADKPAAARAILTAGLDETMRTMIAGAWLAVVAVLGTEPCVLAAEPAAAGNVPAEAPAAPADVPQRGGYAFLEIGGTLAEALPAVYLFESEEDTLHSMLGRIEMARTDAGLRGIIVRIAGLEAGWSKVQDLRAALVRCRDAGKEVVCLLEGGDNLDYYLAAAGDRIVLAPAAHLMVSGLRAEAIFARGLLDKLGIEPDFVQAGAYKTAGESLTNTGPSPAFRESIESLLDDYYGQLVGAVATGRGLTVEGAQRLLADGPYTAKQALAAGLVDAVMFYDELVTDLRRRNGGALIVQHDYGLAKRRPVAPPGPFELLRMLMGGPRAEPPTSGPAIAVLHAVGPIIVGEKDDYALGDQAICARQMVETIRQVAANDDIKALVLRIDSPGGSALASDLIWRELRLLDGRKPVIASFSNMAASGGYYIGAGARRILAEPGSLTGSIGVFGGKLVLTGLFEKIGLNVVAFERGGPTSMDSAFELFSEQDRKKLQALLLSIYQTFLERVAETRPGLDVAGVEKVAQGRVWTGRQAFENGLVDELGDLGDAILAARRAAGIPAGASVEIVRLPRPRSVLEAMLLGLTTSQTSGAALPWALDGLPHAGRVRAYLRALLALRGEPAACILPVLISVR